MGRGRKKKKKISKEQKLLDLFLEKDEGVPQILVCQGSSCRKLGSKVVLAEIEELAKLVGECHVRPDGCQNACDLGPNAVIITKDRGIEKHVEIRSFEARARVVKLAMGKNPITYERKAKSKHCCAQMKRTAHFHWNSTLGNLEKEGEESFDRHRQRAEILRKAGFKNGVAGTELPYAIENYAQWSVNSVEPVSKHSAIFKMSCTDPNRSTPHPKKGRRKPVTWHSTMLAEVGENSEGPLPWIEREYTPISSSKEWERGYVDILVKIYHNGAATSWLYDKKPKKLWLSEPVKTLHVPSLSPHVESFSPKSVLLILAGTGVVALPQILYHRDPQRKLGIRTPKRSRLLVPIDLVLSCREDDVLLLPQIAKYCDAGESKGIRQCTLLLTPANDSPAPFPQVTIGNKLEAEKLLEDIPNARIMQSRLNPEIIQEAAEKMVRPCRVLVSGPKNFNTAAREMLQNFFEMDEIVVLSA